MTRKPHGPIDDQAGAVDQWQHVCSRSGDRPGLSGGPIREDLQGPGMLQDRNGSCAGIRKASACLPPDKCHNTEGKNRRFN